MSDLTAAATDTTTAAATDTTTAAATDTTTAAADTTNQEKSSENKGGPLFYFILILVIVAFIILWIAPGITAVVCVGRTGGFWSQFFGILIAMLTGPFYWIYFLLHKNYCKSRNFVNPQQQFRI